MEMVQVGKSVKNWKKNLCRNRSKIVKLQNREIKKKSKSLSKSFAITRSVQNLKKGFIILKNVPAV